MFIYLTKVNILFLFLHINLNSFSVIFVHFNHFQFSPDIFQTFLIIRNKRTLWTPRAFHTATLRRPTPHQAYREPQPSALRAREAPDSGAAAVAATPCRGNRFFSSWLGPCYLKMEIFLLFAKVVWWQPIGFQRL